MVHASDHVNQTLATLNPQQREAVQSGEGPLLIIAGPGSGKTRVLTARVAYLIQEMRVAPWNILALTFTNKAAREMKDRVEQLVGERARWVTMGTFHSFSARVLRQYGGEIGIDPRFVIYDSADQLGVIKSVMNDLDINAKQFAPRSVLGAISGAKSRNIDAATYASAVESYWEEIVARIYPEYQATMKRRNALDFDDLLSETLRLLQQSDYTREQLQQRYQHVLVDEYQDTNHLQYLIVNELAKEHRNLCVVGDPDQSIYGWRAADIRNILYFTRDYPDAQQINLEENYRSTPEILTAADAVIQENSQKIERALRTSRPAGKPLVIRESIDEQFEARFVAEEIMRLQNDEGYVGSDIAVLYRTNAQSRTIEEACIRAGIPYQLIGGTRFYERREIKDVMALLRLLANPDDTVAFERVIGAYPIGQGIGAKTLGTLESWSQERNTGLQAALHALDQPEGPALAGRARNLLTDAREQIERLRSLAETLPLTQLFDRALEETGYIRQFENAGPEMVDRWENLLQLRATLEPFDQMEDGDRLMTFLEEAALVSDADSLTEEYERVTLITLHAVKGLEFKVVFITGVEDGLIPHQRSITENPEMIEEERRLFYVGITRAQERLYLTFARRRSRFGYADLANPSSFLLSIPEDVIGDVPTRKPSRPRPTATTWDDVSADVPQSEFQFTSGQRVFHNKFGDGTVLKVVDKANDQELVVEFKRHGQKRLMASLANLTVG
ncbi:MAG: ATP-dependent helicase [Chloroflexota bacterium]